MSNVTMQLQMTMASMATMNHKFEVPVLSTTQIKTSPETPNVRYDAASVLKTNM